MNPYRWPGVALVKIACVYLLTSLVLGLYMAMSQDHALMSVHSHIGLLGWVTMAMTGVAYLVLPGLASSPLAAMHFWLHNTGLPVMMISLTVLVRTGNERAEPFIGIGSFLVLAALLTFTVNVWRNGNAATARTPSPRS